jgi:glycosyltransferase involved in cell wall biosynthesis
MENIKKICVISCPIATRSGYGSRSRDFVRALISVRPDWEIKLLSQRWGNCPMDALKEGKDDDLLSRIYIPEQNPPKPNVWIQITVPNEFQPVGDYNIGVTAGVETTVMPAECLEGINRMDKVLVSSTFTKQCAENTVFDKKDEKGNNLGSLKCEKVVDVLFEGYDTKIYDNKAPIESRINDTLSKIDESFCFLFVGHWLKGDFEQDRKNISGMIWTFLQAFANKKNPPALLLKTSSGGTSLPDRHRIRKIIQDMRGKLPGRLPNIYLLHSDLTDKEVNSLYNHPKVKAHVSFTRGEGFGRPLLEATISGKPMVVSAWSGHMDFLNPEYVCCISGKMENVHKSAADKFILKEAQWFTIDYSVAGGTMKDIHKNYKLYLEKSRKHRQYTKERFTFDKMAELLDTYLKDVDSKPQTVGLKLPKLKKVNKPVETPSIKLPKLKKVK